MTPGTAGSQHWCLLAATMRPQRRGTWGLLQLLLPTAEPEDPANQWWEEGSKGHRQDLSIFPGSRAAGAYGSWEQQQQHIPPSPTMPKAKPPVTHRGHAHSLCSFLPHRPKTSRHGWWHRNRAGVEPPACLPLTPAPPASPHPWPSSPLPSALSTILAGCLHRLRPLCPCRSGEVLLF